MHTIQFAAHVAYLDPMTGEGLLVRPRPEDDLSLGGVGLHESDWGRVIAELDRLGWEPTEDDDGLPMFDGMTTDGREVVGLYGREPITSMPSRMELADADVELGSMAGLVPGSSRA
jgi:hypothetical protein